MCVQGVWARGHGIIGALGRSVFHALSRCLSTRSSAVRMVAGGTRLARVGARIGKWWPSTRSVGAAGRRSLSGPDARDPFTRSPLVRETRTTAVWGPSGPHTHRARPRWGWWDLRHRLHRRLCHRLYREIVAPPGWPGGSISGPSGPPHPPSPQVSRLAGFRTPPPGARFGTRVDRPPQTRPGCDAAHTQAAPHPYRTCPITSLLTMCCEARSPA